MRGSTHDGQIGKPKRHQNHGLRKVCGCPRRKWPKCEHGWHFNFKPRGGPSYRFSLDAELGRHVGSKTEAIAEAEKIRLAIRGGTFRRQADVVPVTTPPATPEAITFEHFARTYLDRRGKPATANDTAHLNRLATFCLPGPDARTLGTKPLGAITEDDCEVFFAQLRQEGRAAATLNKYRLFLSAMFRWAVRKGYLTRSPIADSETIRHQSEKAARRSRRLAPDAVDDRGNLQREGEERRLLAVANPSLQRLIIGALETGMRRGELLSLRWESVDLTRRELKVRAETSKSRRTRVLPISARLAAIFEMARTDPTGRDFGPLDHVFGDAVGRKILSTKKAWETTVLKAHGHAPEWIGSKLSVASRARLRAIDLHFHDLRHEAGSRFIEAGWPVHHVQEMLGHSDLKQTSTYLNATLGGLKDSMRRFDEAGAGCKPVENPPTMEPQLACNGASPRDGNSLVN
jgi:integrase